MFAFIKLKHGLSTVYDAFCSFIVIFPLHPLVCPLPSMGFWLHPRVGVHYVNSPMFGFYMIRELRTLRTFYGDVLAVRASALGRHRFKPSALQQLAESLWW